MYCERLGDQRGRPWRLDEPVPARSDSATRFRAQLAAGTLLSSGSNARSRVTRLTTAPAVPVHPSPLALDHRTESGASGRQAASASHRGRRRRPPCQDDGRLRIGCGVGGGRCCLHAAVLGHRLKVVALRRTYGETSRAEN